MNVYIEDTYPLLILLSYSKENRTKDCLEVRKDEYQTQLLNSSYKIPSFFVDFSLASSAPSTTVLTPRPTVATHEAEYLNSWMIALLVVILHSSIG